MTIWRCASGGYHSGKDCYEEFRKLLKHSGAKRDLQLVRLVERKELLAELSTRYPSVQFFEADIDAILETLVHLTPDDKKSWEKLHKEI